MVSTQVLKLVVCLVSQTRHNPRVAYNNNVIPSAPNAYSFNIDGCTVSLNRHSCGVIDYIINIAEIVKTMPLQTFLSMGCQSPTLWRCTTVMHEDPQMRDIIRVNFEIVNCMPIIK